ncbi:MAG TPA: shikimate kinase [bacterium]|nr:shikimate kinase [bacterium]
MPQNIALIGGRGTGKSTVARQLADKLNRPLYVMDELIPEKADGLTIPEIVSQFGWKHFRELEYQVARKLSDLQDIVIDCGGGVVCEQDEQNNQSYSDRKIEALKKHGMIVWLDCPVALQIERIGADPNRPSLTGNKSTLEEMEEVMHLRRPWYAQAADFTIATDKFTPDQIVEQILNVLKIENKEN